MVSDVVQYFAEFKLRTKFALILLEKLSKTGLSFDEIDARRMKIPQLEKWGGPLSVLCRLQYVTAGTDNSNDDLRMFSYWSTFADDLLEEITGTRPDTEDLFARDTGIELNNLRHENLALREQLAAAQDTIDQLRKISKLANNGAMFRHEKRGTVYRVIAPFRLQLDGPDDMADCIMYQGVDDGECWGRKLSEFTDGRFSVVPPQADDVPDEVDEAIAKENALFDTATLAVNRGTVFENIEKPWHKVVLRDVTADEVRGGWNVLYYPAGGNPEAALAYSLLAFFKEFAVTDPMGD